MSDAIIRVHRRHIVQHSTDPCLPRRDGSLDYQSILLRSPVPARVGYVKRRHVLELHNSPGIANTDLPIYSVETLTVTARIQEDAPTLINQE